MTRKKKKISFKKREATQSLSFFSKKSLYKYAVMGFFVASTGSILYYWYDFSHPVKPPTIPGFDYPMRTPGNAPEKKSSYAIYKNLAGGGKAQNEKEHLLPPHEVPDLALDEALDEPVSQESDAAGGNGKKQASSALQINPKEKKPEPGKAADTRKLDASKKSSSRSPSVSSNQLPIAASKILACQIGPAYLSLSQVKNALGLLKQTVPWGPPVVVTIQKTKFNKNVIYRILLKGFPNKEALYGYVKVLVQRKIPHVPFY